jgi:hypothetical protein
MPAPVNGRETRLALIPEAVFNVINGSPVGELIYIRSEGVRGSQSRTVDPTMAGSLRGRLATIRNERNVAGPIAVTPNAQSMLRLLQQTFGAPTVRRPAQNPAANARITGTTISGVELLGCNTLTPGGTGTLTFALAGTTLSWTAPSGTAGTAINVNAGGLFTLPGSAANTELYVRVTAGAIPAGNTTDNAITVYTPAFEYRFAPLADIPAGFTLERDRGTKVAAGNRYHRRTGNRINTVDFAFAASGIADATFNVVGADFSDSATVIDATLDDFGHNGFSNGEGTVVINRAAALGTYKNFRATINNNLDTSARTIGGGGVLGALEAGLIDFDGSLEALFDSAQILAWAAADTPVAIQHQCRKGHGGGTVGNEYLCIDFPRALFTEEPETIDGPQGTNLTANFSAYRNAGAEIDAAIVVRCPRATV